MSNSNSNKDTFFQQPKDKKISELESSEQHEKVMHFLTESDEALNAIDKLLQGINQNIMNNNNIKQDPKKQENNQLISQNLALANAHTATLHTKVRDEELNQLVKKTNG